MIPRRVFVWAPVAGWLIAAGGWVAAGDDPCFGCGGGPALQIVASLPFLMTMFVFPYNLNLTLFAGAQSYVVSFGLILSICAVMALIMRKFLPTAADRGSQYAHIKLRPPSKCGPPVFLGASRSVES